jgi:hypothetical protein
MNMLFRPVSYSVSVFLLTIALGCSKPATSSQPMASPSGYGVVTFDQPSSRWPLLHLAAAPPGVEPYLFMLFFTNALPPGLRSTIAISETMKYEWHKAAMDGTMSTARGMIPANLSDALMAEWSSGAGRTNLNRRLEQAVYVGTSDGVHPSQVQRLLDYVSK